MTQRPTHDEKGIEIMWTNPNTNEWGTPDNHYFIVKDGRVNAGSNVDPEWVDGLLLWTAYGAGTGGKYVAGWTQDESASVYKTTRRKLPEGGRWVVVKYTERDKGFSFNQKVEYRRGISKAQHTTKLMDIKKKRIAHAILCRLQESGSRGNAHQSSPHR
jgi:hypothetical protein